MERDLPDVAAQARTALAEGRMRDAAELYQLIVGLAPDQADNWYNLGCARRGSRDFVGALDAYSRALELGLEAPEDAYVNRAVILKDDLERSLEAESELKKALAIAPKSASTWVNLGLLYEVLGRRIDAIEAYEHAVLSDVRTTGAHVRLAALEPDPERAVTNLVGVLRRGRLTQEQAGDIEFALANALDRAERYREAFMVASKANARRAALRLQMFRYDRLAHERFVDASIKEFQSGPTAPPFRADIGQIFLCGMFRSGSTLAEQLLGRHPAIATAGELEAIPIMVRETLPEYPELITGIDRETRDRLREQYIGANKFVAKSYSFVTDKRSDNFLHIGLIKMLFPEATIVHTVRNPLDVAISTWFLDFAEPISYTTSLIDIGHYLVQYRRIMDHWENVLGEQILSVDYEKLVADSDATLEPVYRALGLNPADAKDRDISGPIRTPSAWAVRGALHSRSVGRWQNYAEELEPVRAALGL